MPYDPTKIIIICYTCGGKDLTDEQAKTHNKRHKIGSRVEAETQ